MFDWNQLYTLLKTKIEKAVSCTVGRYKTPKETEFPYVDIILSDNSGKAYDLQNNEGAQNPLITIDVYCNGSSADSNAYEIAIEAKNVITAYGYKCISGPVKATSTSTSIARCTGRYQRMFASGDVLSKMN